MPDACFEDEYLASIYDAVEVHGGADEQFYLDLAGAADRVLDVGCGTGVMLHTLRDGGHRGRLVGLDPAAGVLARARRRGDVEWVAGHLPEAGFDRDFALVFMTGHAFQTLVDDAATLELLDSVRRALAPGGRFAFETRNPLVRAWEGWRPDVVAEVTDGQGRRVRIRREVESVDGDRVSFAERFHVAGSDTPITSRTTLRFPTAEQLDAVLARAGFVVDGRYGDWDRSPFTGVGQEIITVAVPQ